MTEFVPGERVTVNFRLPKNWGQVGTVAYKSFITPNTWWVELDGRKEDPVWFREDELEKI